jgi:hypothetical protein
MSLQQSLQTRLPSWLDLLALGLMSLAAPWIAAYIHSACVFLYGFRFYNAEVGRIYFHGNGAVSEQPSFWIVFTWIGCFGIPAVPTFLALLPFRRRTSYRWIGWACFIILWTWLFFKMEIAYH